MDFEAGRFNQWESALNSLKGSKGNELLEKFLQITDGQLAQFKITGVINFVKLFEFNVFNIYVVKIAEIRGTIIVVIRNKQADIINILYRIKPVSFDFPGYEQQFIVLGCNNRC
jgi:hypothetical protein